MKQLNQTKRRKQLVILSIIIAMALAYNGLLVTAASADPKPVKSPKSTKATAKAKPGTKKQKVKPQPKHQNHPAGHRIAFMRNHDIWIMNPDGSKQVNLTKSKQAEDSPSWSPDGKRLAFTRGEKQGSLVVNNQIFEIDLATKKIQKITAIKNEHIEGPSYTAAGTGILFQSFQRKAIPDEDKDYPAEHYRYKLNVVEIKTKKMRTIRAGNYLYEAGEFARPFMLNHFEICYAWWTEAFASFEKLNLVKQTIDPLHFTDVKATDQKLYYLAFSKNKTAAGLLDIYANPRLFIKDLKQKKLVKLYASSFTELTPQAFSPQGNKLAVTISATSGSGSVVKDYVCVLEIDKNKLIQIADDANKAVWQP